MERSHDRELNPRSWLPTDWAAALVLLFASLWTGCHDLTRSGMLWPDSSQYANAAAMIHDWLLSGRWSDPMQFAVVNYSQYPGFHMPYHPPAFPGLLGAFFVLTGVTWEAARVFMALCLFVSCGSFYLIVRRMGTSGTGALLASLLLMTMPVVCHWSRDTMSEIPGLALILTATWLFLRWADGEGGALLCVAAFALAEAAFLSRLLTAGILPVWFAYALATGGWRRVLRPVLILCSVAYVAVNAGWVHWVKQFSRFETFSGGVGPAVNYSGPLQVAGWYAGELPAITGWAVLCLATAGVIAAGAASLRHRKAAVWFWVLWVISYLAFVSLVGIYHEDRYFVYGAPAFAGLVAAGWVAFQARSAVAGQLASACLCLCVLGGAWRVLASPTGFMGFEPVAAAMARQSERGNVLVGTIHHADLMFRYRCIADATSRTFVRSDRTLVLRPPGYFDGPTTVLASSDADVLDVIRRGRIRYVVSYVPADNYDVPDWRLLHEAVRRHPEQFTLAGQWPLTDESRQNGLIGTAYVWRYSGVLPQGKSELPLLVPTADPAALPGVVSGPGKDN